MLDTHGGSPHTALFLQFLRSVSLATFLKGTPHSLRAIISKCAFILQC